LNRNDSSKQPPSSERLETALKLLDQMEELQQVSPQKRTELVYNLLMQAERSLHLEKEAADKANGYYPRSLGTAAGRLQLQVPRDRDGNFRPQLLPAPFERDSIERLELLQALLTASYSPSAIRSVLSSLGMHYSEKELDRLREAFLAEFEAWISRQLSKDLIAIYIDAYHTQVQEKTRVKKMVLYTVLGLDFQGTKDLLGVYLCAGSETKTFWLQVLNDLIDRGLQRLLLVVSDQFPGLTDAVSTLFSQATHQLCFVHLQPNVRHNMGPKDAQIFNRALGQIKLESDFEAGLDRLQSLMTEYEEAYPAFISRLQKQAPRYLAFLHLPEPLRKYFYTTNAVESFHSSLEAFRIRSGGFFQSSSTLKLNVFIHYRKLQSKWQKGVPHVRSHLYWLRQRFAQIYGDLPNGL